jgi:hypothetical protein
MSIRKLLLLLFLNIIYFGNVHGQCLVTSTPTSNTYYGYVCISNVALAGQTTPHPGGPSNGYNYFSTPVRNMTIGSSYPFTVTLGFYQCGVAIWIDLNNNGQYETTEMLSSSPSSYGPVTGSITIPPTATAATNVRMRVRACYYFMLNSGQACTNNPGYGYGETEDYLVNLISPCAGPTITGQPGNQLACPDGNVNFSMSATSAATYKWQVSTNGGTSFSDITNNAIYSGSTTNTLTLTTLPSSYAGYQYRCRATSGCGTPTLTSVATLTLHTPVSIASQTMSVTSCEGAAKSLNVTIGPGVVNNYRWQIGSLTNGFTDLTPGFPYLNINTAQLDITNMAANMNGLDFRCIIEGPCSADTSNGIPVNVIIGPYISREPLDDTIPPYATATFDVKTLGTPYYELFWQASTDGGGTYANLNDNSLYQGTHGIALNVKNAPPNLTGMKFRCILKSTNVDCGIYYDTSEAAILYVGNYGGLSVKSSTDIPENAMSLFPNPATGNEIYLTMKNPINAELSVSVVDKLGKNVYNTTGNLSKKNSKLNINALAPGVYSVQVTDVDGNRISSLQFTKQ